MSHKELMEELGRRFKEEKQEEKQRDGTDEVVRVGQRLQQAQCVEIDADDEEEGEGAGPQDERGLEAALSQLRVE